MICNTISCLTGNQPKFDNKWTLCYTRVQLIKGLKMSEKVELYCTYDEGNREWLVWFPHPLGGMNVLETFDNEVDAR